MPGCCGFGDGWTCCGGVFERTVSCPVVSEGAAVGVCCPVACGDEAVCVACTGVDGDVDVAVGMCGAVGVAGAEGIWSSGSPTELRDADSPSDVVGVFGIEVMTGGGVCGPKRTDSPESEVRLVWREDVTDGPGGVLVVGAVAGGSPDEAMVVAASAVRLVGRCSAAGVAGVAGSEFS